MKAVLLCALSALFVSDVVGGGLAGELDLEALEALEHQHLD